MKKPHAMVALAALVLGAWVSSGRAQTNAVPPANQRVYRLGTNGMLVLTLPPGWVDNLKRVKEKDGTYDAIFITSSDPNEFRFVVEIAGYGDNHPNAEGMKVLLLRNGNRELTNTLETSLTLRDFQGGQSTGAYYRVTDRRLADATGTSADFKYMTRGFAILGPLVLSFELVSNNAELDEPPAIEVLRQARLTH